MTRALSFLIRNWPLKLAAVGLAMLLYAGLTLSQGSREWLGQLRIDVRNQPATAVLIGGVQYVTSIRYLAPVDVAGRLTADSFTARVDLATAAPDASGGLVAQVLVDSPDPQVHVLGWVPGQIAVRLDPLRERTVPVRVDRGVVPSNLQVHDPVTDVSEVTVSGTQSAVSQVVSAVARVRIDPSGVSIDQSVDLVAVDARGETVGQVSLSPSSARVRILVGSQLQNKSLPVHPVFTGTPATGFEVASVTVSPISVTLEGDVGILASLVAVDTLPISVSGATATVNQTVALDLPPGTDALGGSSASVTVTLRPVLTTRSFTVGVVLSGARDDRTYGLSTDQVIVVLGGSAADLQAIQGQTFAVTADVDGLAPGVHQVGLKVALPAGINLVSVSPARITVTVSPAASPSPSSSAGP